MALMRSFEDPTGRSRLILNLGLSYLARRGIGWCLLTDAKEIETALALTDEERAEAREIADGLEEFFNGRHPSAKRPLHRPAMP